MDTSSVVLYGLIGLAVICFVLDRWVLPRDASPPPPDPEAEMRAAEERRREAVFREADLQLERERIRRMRKECVFSLNAIVDPRDVLPTLTFSCSGKVPWHEFSRQFVTLELEDITDAEPRLIRCSDPDFSDPATGFCRFSPDILFPSDELLDGSWDLAKVPLSSLSAPFAGRRLVRINYQLGPRGSVPEDVTKRASRVLEVNLFNPGYEDELGAGRVAVQTMELAIACGLAGRRRLGPSLKVLSPWVDDILNAVKKEDAPYFEVLRSAMDHLWSEGLPEGYEIDQACAGVKAYGSGTVEPTLDLCLRMSTADGSWPKEAVVMVRRIAQLVGLSSADIQALLDRHLITSSVNLEACDWESLTAMDPSWESARLRKHLVAYFDRWNSRAPSARTTGEQARIRSILEAIAKLRQKYA
jgi:hypothetical protein